MHEKERRMVAETCSNGDAAITLCCDSGCEGIKTALPETFNTIPGMKAIGIFNAHVHMEGGKDFLDKEKTKIMFFQRTPL